MQFSEPLGFTGPIGEGNRRCCRAGHILPLKRLLSLESDGFIETLAPCTEPVLGKCQLTAPPLNNPLAVWGPLPVPTTTAVHSSVFLLFLGLSPTWLIPPFL